VVISAGGTGGGVYPALAVAGALRALYPALTMTFVGARGDVARDLVARSDVRFDGYREVLVGPLHGVSRLTQVTSAFKIAIGIVQSLILAIRLRPDVLFLTGGWVGFPMAAACWLLRRPIVIYVPDIEPGLTLRLLGRYFARTVAATMSETAAFFPGKRVVATGYPLRREILEADRDKAIQALALDPSRRTLLVFGGSRGSRSINLAMRQIAPDLLADGLQIVHISGRLDWEQVQAQHAALSDEQRARYFIFSFMPDIGQAFAAADLVVSRSGAATLAEYPEHDLPAILVPYPYAWRYQKINADWLVERGAAVRLDDDRLATELLPTIRSLLNDPGRLESMRAAAAALKRSDGAENIARLLANAAGHPGG
jgi:UDP-N-acetylglucosamine--N-acetylmuramyl-(pentapeptide) pyrophosphoryl-undecaprenol N-acetylglucosamine transferase